MKFLERDERANKKIKEKENDATDKLAK